MKNNEVRLIGTVNSNFLYSHKVNEEEIYLVHISSKRTSGYEDIIPVHITKQLMSNFDFKIGQRVEIYGSFRNYSFRKSDGKRGSRLYVFAESCVPSNEVADDNHITIEGYIGKVPTYRETLSGRRIADSMIKVHRYNNIDYIPCISWGRNAEYMAGLSVGDYINASGRIQSRPYQKIVDGYVEDKITYEVSIAYIHLDKPKGCEVYEEIKA